MCVCSCVSAAPDRHADIPAPAHTLRWQRCAAQDNVLNSIACHALARMAYVAPDLVLPLMHERFEVRIADLLLSVLLASSHDAMVTPIEATL